MKISEVVETKGVYDELVKYNILEQYKKAKSYILAGNVYNVDLKLRKPKKYKIYYFRINKQFRAFCILEDTILRVYKIDNHQN